MDKEREQYLKKETTKNFIRSAEQFVWLNEQSEITLKEYLPRLHSALLWLYTAMHNLETPNETFTLKDIRFIKQTFYPVVSGDPAGFYPHLQYYNNQYYWCLGYKEVIYYSNPNETDWNLEENKPTLCSLFEDIKYIYEDLVAFLKVLEHDAFYRTAHVIAWNFSHVKELFETRWGDVCIEALHYLHYLNYEGKGK